jgi:hypothetical protein
MLQFFQARDTGRAVERPVYQGLEGSTDDRAETILIEPMGKFSGFPPNESEEAWDNLPSYGHLR